MIIAIVKFNVNNDSPIKFWQFDNIPNDWYYNGNKIILNSNDEYINCEYFSPKNKDNTEVSTIITFLEEHYSKLQLEEIIINYVVQMYRNKK